MIPTGDFIAIKDLVVSLASTSESCWTSDRTFADEPISRGARTTFETLGKLVKQLTSQDLRKMMKSVSAKLELPQHFSIFLPPLSDDPLFVPLLTFELHSKPPKAYFRIDLYRFDDSSSRLDHVGFRFETPTFASKKHGYFHVQPIEESSAGILPATNKSYKKTGTVPCLPVYADGPVSLMLSLVLSLYGKQGYVKLMSQISMPVAFRKPLTICFEHGEKWETRGWGS